jgi:Protein of unknown function (DUF3800)
MTALGLHRLVPRSLLARKWVIVLVCYLDDSGKDPQNPITTLAGYVAKDTAWDAFEADAEPIFEDCGVKVLHTRDLENTHGEFKCWRKLQKQAFVSRLSTALSRHAIMGMSVSAAKSVYKQRADESGRKRTITPYAWCFNLIVQWLLTDIRVGRLTHSEGVAFILETGHENNPEAEQVFHDVRRLYDDAALALRSITFVPKEECRAVQMADLFAFYSRRHGKQMYLAPQDQKAAMRRDPGIMLKIMTERLSHRAYVASDFGPDIPSRPLRS